MLSNYIIALLATGAGVGFASGLLGVGGCFVMIPVQYWIYTAIGVPADVAIKVAFDHAINPRNPGDMEDADAAFMTDGCGNAIASCSMVTEMCKGKIVSEAQKLGQQDVLAALDGLPEEGKHCALLAADTLKEAIKDYLTMERKP